MEEVKSKLPRIQRKAVSLGLEGNQAAEIEQLRSSVLQLQSELDRAQRDNNEKNNVIVQDKANIEIVISIY